MEASDDVYRVTLILPSRESLMKAVIADDEDLARGIVREYLLRECPEIGDRSRVLERLRSREGVRRSKPDVLFLDIQMPKLDGFEVLELIDARIAVVFVTAFDQYAMRAFDAAAVDYLLKPFGMERFRAAMEKVARRVGEERPASLPAKLKNAARPAGESISSGLW